MKKAFTAFLLVVIFTGASFQVAHASKVVRLKTVITPGVLIADVRTPTGDSISNPTLDFGKVINTLECRTQLIGLNGIFGDDQERIYVDNPKATFDGWTLTVSPADGANSTWQGDRSKHKFDFNDAGGAGCSDTDGDGYAGLMTVDPSEAVLRPDCLECTTEYISLGSKSARTFAETPSITLLNAGDLSDIVGSWYLTGIKISQTVPPAQDGDSYHLDLVLTATAS